MCASAPLHRYANKLARALFHRRICWTFRCAATQACSARLAAAAWWLLGQRTRWFKGWMQTWLVHMREPRQLSRDLGGAGTVAFQLIVGGNALVPLLHPVFIA